MTRMNSLKDLFVEEIRDLYSAETQLVDALPAMAQIATNSTLQSAIQDHWKQTKQQLMRIEEICDTLKVSPDGVTCKAMKGLIAETNEVMNGVGDPNVKDAALIACAQRIEHYEIAGYGCLRTFARKLGLKDAEKLLQQSLNEEAAADEKMTRIAETQVNDAAAKGSPTPAGQTKR